MYAEATLRGATIGNTATALGYINKIRARANARYYYFRINARLHFG
jgi:hypothetical protein